MIRVRRATASDSAAACAVVRRSISELCGADHAGDEATILDWLANKTPDNFAAWISSPRHVALVAERGGAVAGFALLNRNGTIALLYVAPESRFAGVSKALLASVEDAAISLGIAALELESTATALAFYESRGYVRTGGAVRGFGVTRGFPLSKSLARPGHPK